MTDRMIMQSLEHNSFCLPRDPEPNCYLCRDCGRVFDTYSAYAECFCGSDNVEPYYDEEYEDMCRDQWAELMGED